MPVQRLLDGNRAFVSSMADESGLVPSPQGEEPSLRSPWGVVVTCMDPRIPAERVLGLSAGEAFVVRTPAAFLDGAAKAGVALAVSLDSVDCVLVMGHTDCAAVRCAMKAARGEAEGAETEVAARLPKTDSETDALSATRAVVESCVEIARSLVAEHAAPRSIEVVGGILDLRTGIVEKLDDAG